MPGYLTEISLPGLTGCESDLSHPLVNRVGCANLEAAAADGTINAIRDRFAASNKSFGWFTSPASRPADLTQRLRSAGFVKAEELAGMVLTQLSTPIRANPEVEVRAATAGEQRRAVAMTAEAYGLPVDVAELITEVSIRGAGQVESRMYHAFVPGNSDPVAFGTLVFVPGTNMVLLGGAATLGGYRGRGIYSSLVARRLVDAQAAGATAAVVQAVRTTSAPVLANLGFREVLPLEFYVWAPPGA
ncbi:MAG TPA: hypothetical protein VF134_07955 [Candidatus Dormibacteraeota bacterium]